MPKDDKTADKVLSPEVQQLQQLYEVMLEKGLDALELKDEELRVKLTRHFAAPAASFGVPHPVVPSAHPRSAPAGAPAKAVPESGNAASVISTPLAGVFYRASSPTSAPFIHEGDTAEAGQTLCIIEAMKVMNEIKAESRCRIIKIVAENGRPMTAGQALFHFEPV